MKSLIYVILVTVPFFASAGEFESSEVEKCNAVAESAPDTLLTEIQISKLRRRSNASQYPVRARVMARNQCYQNSSESISLADCNMLADKNWREGTYFLGPLEEKWISQMRKNCLLDKVENDQSLSSSDCVNTAKKVLDFQQKSEAFEACIDRFLDY